MPSEHRSVGSEGKPYGWLEEGGSRQRDGKYQRLYSSHRSAWRVRIGGGSKVAVAEVVDRVIWSKQDMDCCSFLLSGSEPSGDL